MLKKDFRKYCIIIVSLVLLSSAALAQTGIWTRKADMPKWGGAACVVDGKIYFVGGSANSSLDDAAYNIVYDPVRNTYEEKKPMPTARGFLFAAAVDDIIYAIGGGYPVFKLKVEAYDPKTDTWTTKKDMPEGHLGCFNSCVVDGIIYIIGGNYSQGECWAYNPKSDSWTQKKSMPAGSGGGLGYTAYNGLIYTFGGSSQPWAGKKDVYSYDPKEDKWTRLTDMPTARFALQSFVIGDKIYVMGGSTASNNALSTVEVYTPENDQWHTISDMPLKLAWLSGAVVNDRIYLTGGSPNWSYANMQMWEYDPFGECCWTPQNVKFINTTVGCVSDTVFINIKNSSSSSFNISSVQNANNQITLTALPNLPFSLGPSESVRFGVVHCPSCCGRISSEIVIETTNPHYKSITIPVQANAIALGSIMKTFVDSIITADYLNRPKIVENFLAANPVFPIIEQDSICEFIFQSPGSTASVVGDANGWNINTSPMSKLSSTNLWYFSDIYPRDARIEYKFVLDGSAWVFDPKNPKRDLAGINSEIAMPGYIYPEEMVSIPYIPHGFIKDTVIFSEKLKNSRNISIYLPPDYKPGISDSFNLVLFHDGADYQKLAKARNTLDYLIYNKLIEPVICVFVTPVNRNIEYIGSQQNLYLEFIVDELMPYIDTRYKTRLNPVSRATIGISNGGNIALLLLNKYPQKFGNAASHSGNILNTTFSAFSNSDMKANKVYIDAGIYDLPGFLELSESFSALLDTKTYNYRFYKWNEGHNWGNWGSHLDMALQYFFPKSVVSADDKESRIYTYSLMQNYPNPFNPNTVISYELPEASPVEISVFNILGQKVAVLVNSLKPAGAHETVFNASNLSSGIYVYRMKAKNFTSVKKMMLIK